LDEELSRLPDKYRTVLVLCDLQGKGRPEVARQLSLPEGSVGSRLARGRAMLAKRLARRGVSVSGVTLAAVLPQQAAAVPTAVLSTTIQGVSLLAPGGVTVAGAISAQVCALTEGVLKAMVVARWKWAAIVLLTAGFASAAGLLAHHLLPAQRGDVAKTRPAGETKGGNRSPEIEKYGTEEDAISCVKRWGWLPPGYVPAFGGIASKWAAIPREQWTAKLNPETGQWTVTWPDNPKDLKGRRNTAIVCYNPSEHRWHKIRHPLDPIPLDEFFRR
jgi:hypothetical protein